MSDRRRIILVPQALNRLTDFQRGTLSKSAGSSVFDTVATSNTNLAGSTVNWSLDALGNPASITTDGTTQSRTTDQQNELTTLSTGTNSTTLTYDNSGDLLTDDQGHHLEYDLWHRLVRVKDAAGNLLESFGYDALSRSAAWSRLSDQYRDYYYSPGWQLLQEDDQVLTGLAVIQNVWGLGYIDDLVERDRDTNADGTLDERVWAQQDANHNVTSIADNSGTVLERFLYGPYGDFHTVDASTWLAASDSKAWRTLYQGLKWDDTSKLFAARNRFYSPSLQRWTQQDPAGYVDGANQYQFVSSSPVCYLDPSGCSKSNDLVLKLLDLEARQQYDRSQHSGKLGKDGEWLEKEMFKVRFELTQTDTVFAIYRRDIHVGGAAGVAGNACGGHWLVSTAAPPWRDGEVIGYALTDVHARAGAKGNETGTGLDNRQRQTH